MQYHNHSGIFVLGDFWKGKTPTCNVLTLLHPPQALNWLVLIKVIPGPCYLILSLRLPTWQTWKLYNTAQYGVLNIFMVIINSVVQGLSSDIDS
jgi:hypothetical protein